MEKNMATDETNNTPEFCLPHELLANDNRNDLSYQGGISKSRQKLKDLLLSVDTKEDISTHSLQHDLSVTTQSNSSTLNTSNFSSCMRESRNLTTLEPADLNNSDLNTVGVGINKHCLKAVIKTQFAENNYGQYSFPNQGTIDNGLDSISDSKSFTENVNATEETHRAAKKQSLIEKVLREEERPQTPNIGYGNADPYVFQNSSFDSNIHTGFDTGDEWDMAINTDDSPTLTPVCSSNELSSRTLLIKQHGTPDTLKQQITQVVGESNMTVSYLEESFDVNKAEMSPIVWFHLLSPLNKQASDTMSLLRTNGNKNAKYIVVSDKIIADELPIHADVYVEPLPKEVIETLLSNVKERDSPIIQNPVKQNSFIRNVSSTPESTISSASGRTSIGSPHRNHSPPRWCRAEHATKEKQRRERIKDSCDQLRLLLPYVKGRKTDMASILEMTVDYLKIVNSALSQDFHSQVIDIMSSGSPPLNDDFFGMNMAYKKGAQKEQGGLDMSSLDKTFHSAPNKADTKAPKSCKEGNLNKRMMTRSLSRTLMSATGEIHAQNSNNNNKNGRNNINHENVSNDITVAKRECSTTKTGSSNPKKPHITLPSLNNKQSRAYEASTASLAIKEYKSENVMDDMTSQNLYHNFQFPHMFTDGDISANRMFSSGHVSSNDGFASYVSHSQINLQATHNIGDRPEMNNYGNVYFDGPYIPYSYSNMQDANNGNYYGTEYVNPNAVLPVTSYTPRVSAFASGRKYERASTSNSDMMQGDSTDVYNNNTI